LISFIHSLITDHPIYPSSNLLKKEKLINFSINKLISYFYHQPSQFSSHYILSCQQSNSNISISLNLICYGCTYPSQKKSLKSTHIPFRKNEMRWDGRLCERENFLSSPLQPSHLPPPQHLIISLTMICLLNDL